MGKLNVTMYLSQLMKITFCLILFYCFNNFINSPCLVLLDPDVIRKKSHLYLDQCVGPVMKYIASSRERQRERAAQGCYLVWQANPFQNFPVEHNMERQTFCRNLYTVVFILLVKHASHLKKSLHWPPLLAARWDKIKTNWWMSYFQLFNQLEFLQLRAPNDI